MHRRYTHHTDAREKNKMIKVVAIRRTQTIVDIIIKL